MLTFNILFGCLYMQNKRNQHCGVKQTLRWEELKRKEEEKEPSYCKH